MNRISPEERWQRFAAAARQGPGITPAQAMDRQPSPGFVARVVARAMQARREFLALLWERWSWRMALATASAALLLGGFVLHHSHQPRLDVPPVTLDVPPLLAP